MRGVDQNLGAALFGLYDFLFSVEKRQKSSSKMERLLSQTLVASVVSGFDCRDALVHLGVRFV